MIATNALNQKKKAAMHSGSFSALFQQRQRHATSKRKASARMRCVVIFFANNKQQIQTAK